MAKQPRSLEQLLTFDRGSAAGYFGRDGKFVWQEPSRNLCPLPSGGVWTIDGGIRDGETPAPDGSLGVWEIEEHGTGLGRLRAYPSAPFDASARCFSAYVRSPSVRYAYIRLSAPDVHFWVDLKEGKALSGATDGGFVSTGVVDVGDGWYRLWASVDTAGGYFIVGVSDTAGDTLFDLKDHRTFSVWGAQAEDADFPSPYVPPGYSPRIEWGAGGTRRGILIEGSSTNEFIHSGDPGRNPWFTTSLSVVGSREGIGIGPGHALVPSANNSINYLLQDTSLVGGEAYTDSYILKADGYQWAQITTSNGFPIEFRNVNLVDGSLGHGTAPVEVEKIPGGWFRVSLAKRAASTQMGRMVLSVMDADRNARLPSFSGDGSSGVLLAGAQRENKAHATSYIPTGPSQVSRAADDAKITGRSFSSWFNTKESTLFVRLRSRPTGTGNSYPFSISDTSYANRLCVFNDTNGLYHARIAAEGSPSIANALPGKYASGETQKIALAAGSGAGVAIGGEVALSAEVSTHPRKARTLYIGQGDIGGATMTGHIEDIRYFPKRLSNDALRALTAP